MRTEVQDKGGAKLQNPGPVASWEPLHLCKEVEILTLQGGAGLLYWTGRTLERGSVDGRQKIDQIKEPYSVSLKEKFIVLGES